MSVYIMQYNYRSQSLVTKEGDEVKFNKDETYKFEEPCLTLKANKISFGKNRICEMTEELDAFDASGLDGNSICLNWVEMDIVLEKQTNQRLNL